MTQHTLKVKSIVLVTCDVLKIVTEYPPQYIFLAGQATEISIQKDHLNNFETQITNNITDDTAKHKSLAFNIKTFISHKDIKERLTEIGKDKTLMLHDIFGTVKYKNEDVLIAGGSGIVQFVDVFKYFNFKTDELAAKSLLDNTISEESCIHDKHKTLYMDESNILAEGSTDIIYNTQAHKTFYVCAPSTTMQEFVLELENF